MAAALAETLPILPSMLDIGKFYNTIPVRNAQSILLLQKIGFINLFSSCSFSNFSVSSIASVLLSNPN